MNNRHSRKSGDSATRHRNSTRWPTFDELKSAAAGRWKDIFYDAAGLDHDTLNGRGHACPRCGGSDRFSAFKDVDERGSVQCRNCFNAGTEPRPGDGIATLQWLFGCDASMAAHWLAGWLGITNTYVETNPAPLRRSVELRSSSGRKVDLRRLADRWHGAMRTRWWSKLESKLGLPAAELKRLRVGWSSQDKATTWPMVDHDDNVVGVRLRCMKTGKKWSVVGGSAGVFSPSELSTGMERLFITEGPTDCAALLSIGFDCIGRPSCNGAVALTTKLVKRLHPGEVVVVADDDANGAGKRGAESLAVALVTACARVRIVYPPTAINDARDWVRGGATADEVLTVVHAARVRSLTFGKEDQQ